MMVGIEELRDIFTNKLQRTGSLDAAFTKAVWIAYTRGREQALEELTKAPVPITILEIKELHMNNVDWSEHYTNIYPLAKNMYYLMSRNDWKEAEPLAKELKEIVTELHRICVANNIQSGIGFTEPYTYEGT
jgi:hypothetical protein